MRKQDRLDAVVERMAPLLLRYFLRRVDDAEDAADLLSETLTIAWRKARSLPSEPDHERAWLYAVASNVLSNHRRSRMRRYKLAEALRAELGAPNAFEASDLSLDVAHALSNLPPPEPELVRLIHWEGLSASDAGRVLGVPESTARARYASARAQLSLALADLAGRDPQRKPPDGSDA